MFIGMVGLIGAIVFFIAMIGTIVIKKYRSRLKKFAIIFGSCLSVFIVSLTLSHIFYPITAEQQAEMDKQAEEKKWLAAKKEEKQKAEKAKIEEEKIAEKAKKEKEKQLVAEAKEKEKLEKEAVEKAEADRLKAEEEQRKKEEEEKKKEEEQRKKEEEEKKKIEEEQRKKEEEKKKAEAEARKAETQQKVLESNYRSAYATHSKKLTDSLNQTGNLLVNNKIGDEEWTIKLAASLIMLQDVTQNPPNAQVPDKFKEVNSLYLQALEKFNQSAKLTPEALDEGNTKKMQRATKLMNDGGEILKSANSLLKEMM
ncbi:TPA: hypothetical protein QCQ87_001248 [Bacillus paranthracis]|nr:hypothetical protein BCPR1_15435 [Bacillus paranthracis]HDR4706281.1 hypothetical protein [Bacillus paranthracis]HDR7276632.1 hypothetical protein [Bacillus paranthracis]HDR7306843.1 hypothetical protein [Bacillus paranthracis]